MAVEFSRKIVQSRFSPAQPQLLLWTLALLIISNFYLPAPPRVVIAIVTLDHFLVNTENFFI